MRPVLDSLIVPHPPLRLRLSSLQHKPIPPIPQHQKPHSKQHANYYPQRRNHRKNREYITRNLKSPKVLQRGCCQTNLHDREYKRHVNDSTCDPSCVARKLGLVVVLRVGITASEGVDAKDSRAEGPAPIYAAETELATAILRIYASKRFVGNAGKSHSSEGGPVLPFQVCRDESLGMGNPRNQTCEPENNRSRK